jgi:hypothetical protein
MAKDKNDITGDKLVSKTPTKEYLDNFDNIFRKPKPEQLELDLQKDNLDEQGTGS